MKRRRRSGRDGRGRDGSGHGRGSCRRRRRGCRDRRRGEWRRHGRGSCRRRDVRRRCHITRGSPSRSCHAGRAARSCHVRGDCRLRGRNGRRSRHVRTLHRGTHASRRTLYADRHCRRRGRCLASSVRGGRTRSAFASRRSKFGRCRRTCCRGGLRSGRARARVRRVGPWCTEEAPRTACLAWPGLRESAERPLTPFTAAGSPLPMDIGEYRTRPACVPRAVL